MDALERVKYALAQLPSEDRRAIAAYLVESLATAEAAAARAEGVPLVATVRAGRAHGPRGGAVTYRMERVRCGKAGCSKCPHGPYAYKYWREGGRLRKAYAGKAAAPAPPADAGKP